MTSVMIPRFAVLDGGFATELVRQGFTGIDDDDLWSSRLLSTNQEAVYNTHLRWLEAGADVIETNTHQASVEGFTKHLQLNEEEALQLIKDGVNIARRARDDFWKKLTDKNGQTSRVKPLVVGSCGPYAVHFYNASEYTGADIDTVSEQELIDWHRPKVEALLEERVDLLALETIPSSVEAKAIVKLLQHYPSAKVWISFSCKDGQHTCRGERFAEACDVVVDCPQVVALGINCTPPQHVTSLLKEIQPIRDKKPIVVYVNSGETWSSDHKWHGGEQCKSPDEYVVEWMELGASWIGGCCRVYPEHITKIKLQMEKNLSKS